MPENEVIVELTDVTRAFPAPAGGRPVHVS